MGGNISIATSDAEKCRDIDTKSYHELFLMKIGVTNSTSLLSDEVQNSKKFMQILSARSVVIMNSLLLKKPMPTQEFGSRRNQC